ncbi:MAG TPA: glutathione S-transferase family protein [Steroidobacteraceae bacterium]|jgi:glutathione S-transferase|nr:glutathione S-transferase family protein [Steroidobacteraceae bacterium]
MPLTLYAHPFAAYCWKALIALYEDATPFTYRVVEDAAAWAELESLWPVRKFPLLRDGEATVVESSIIVEYLMLHYPGASRMIPEAADAALTVRFMDRFFDNYVMGPMQTLVADRMRTASERDAKGVADARKTLDVSYRWLEARLAPHGWVCGGAFTLADCAAAPALFYADWVHPIDDRYAAVRAYRSRVLARPSVARVVEEARPYRNFFPQGAPDRD